jgi:hydrogenase expression/formation protein HypD
MEALLSAPDNVVQGLLAAGHVCAVMGTWQYEPIAARYRLPIVVTGFEPLDLLEGLVRVTCLLEQGRIGVENQYRRAVRREGNVRAQGLIAEVFEPCDRRWRGIGLIPGSGFALKAAYSALDADRRFQGGTQRAEEPTECHAGSILRGTRKPVDCPAFGAGCTPDHPLGAPMVSSEGACAAYFRYGSRRSPSPSKPAAR